MLPVAEEIRTRGVGDIARWPDIIRQVKLRLSYVEKFSDQNGADLLARRNFGKTIDSWDLHNVEGAVFEPLVKNSEIRDLVAFLKHLQTEQDMGLFGPKMEQKLLAKYPTEIEEELFKMWAGFGLSPKDVYESMPIASVSLGMLGDKKDGIPLVNMRIPSVSRELFGTMMDKKPLADICMKLEQFLRYVDFYRGRHIFDDKKVIELLLIGRSEAEVEAYRLFLEDLRDQKKRAAKLLKVLRDTYSAAQIEENLRRAYGIVGRYFLIRQKTDDLSL